MSTICLTLPDGSSRTCPKGTSAGQIAAQIGKRLEEAAVAAIFNGKTVDLCLPLELDGTLKILTRDTAEGLEVLRHSTAHLLAHAVKELYPDSQITIGPVIEDGFYYDIDFKMPITQEDLPAIEKRMEEIAARSLTVSRTEKLRNEAVQYFSKIKEDFKVEIIRGLPDANVSLYTQGDFTDLCRGPHVPNTAKLGKFKLLSLAGAYWRGNENNKMLTRIYGTAWPSQKELDEHLNRLEEARRRDHRKLGPELELFTFLPIAPAMPFYLSKGAWLFNRLAEHMRQETVQMGYQEVICPQLMSVELWKTSGHMDHYSENMFFSSSDGEALDLALKPMNCPGHATLFRTTLRSYRDLPLRMSEFTKLHRNERAGVTHGILRTRTFSQDDGHIFCTEDQVESEAHSMIQHTLRIYKQFGFENVAVKLAIRPEKYIGSEADWQKATAALEKSLQSSGQNYKILNGEGAFYGPKIEFHIRDSIGRYWQCGTVQVDFGLPERFQLEYIDVDGKARRPVMVHRAILGSLERFLGILVEHHAGHFPFWLSPTQVLALNVTDAQSAYTQEVAQALKQHGTRVETDLRNEKLGYKIREAQLKRVPLMLVIGNKEMDSKTLSVRKSNGETVSGLDIDSFFKWIQPALQPGQDLTSQPNLGTKAQVLGQSQ